MEINPTVACQLACNYVNLNNISQAVERGMASPNTAMPSFSTHECLWRGIPHNAVFRYSATLDIPLEITFKSGVICRMCAYRKALSTKTQQEFIPTYCTGIYLCKIYSKMFLLIRLTIKGQSTRRLCLVKNTVQHCPV